MEEIKCKHDYKLITTFRNGYITYYIYKCVKCGREVTI